MNHIGENVVRIEAQALSDLADRIAGPMADAFFVALRLPNNFRAIFAEGAFNAAFIPARILRASGPGLVNPAMPHISLPPSLH